MQRQDNKRKVHVHWQASTGLITARKGSLAYVNLDSTHQLIPQPTPAPSTQRTPSCTPSTHPALLIGLCVIVNPAQEISATITKSYKLTLPFLSFLPFLPFLLTRTLLYFSPT